MPHGKPQSTIRRRGAGTIVVDDRGYNDYRLFGQWCTEDVFFVTRMKRDALYEVVQEREPPDDRPPADSPHSWRTEIRVQRLPARAHVP
jgi:hypothetical protein